MSANIEPPKYGSLGMLAVAIFILAVLMTIVRTAVEPTGATTTYQPDPTSFNHRYATERFRQEGYSHDDSVQAADAVVKFHEAQKRRNRAERK